ncbi:MAG: nucleotide exchange factor GrpE [Candidatus Doudnabacteria bacterium RIFCSPLOWO2_02_FULL_49_13]|uniref:Protein GrpE n=1 Tax=Candidatus Doudnabacteria bacterium RIFCSPHIGHO2_12_FULL_48_16 TaxID=1817838 RepID=A0A1F5PKK1_9BACT|nr:MAG: nucleotide exchange factor GrpE [Candidatus Doudnabacteria bacterium RIFCSPHIGHO2_02_FULL_49_24]OGE89858.1 MAG: nucleotide exchange factor GrpE [Candidatus Doudnabacteria bacterium RIFCSPHIGHO2_01_FULL_50_67]OGE90220.1 MAG: nucleotide exchange factor GrpE [Candidatus Doudnabacteria bacterium RIFCSPHIGHO2_12_FULL_48_16]OGE96782.1 MAG: nucleotide exchange factor GrpE [Candidatus Doudnabacteria bacterium RIFCSPLOWO2_01_FULL_49_40]OGF02859.1 MAG: nucleotide exchange factor GrpE [Candidatus 
MADEQQIPAHPDEPEILSPEDEIVQLTANWKRTAADFENYKKRKEAETREVLEFAKQVTVMKLMPTLQSLEQVLTYAPKDDKYKDWLTGLRATIQQLEKTMEELGVVKIKTVGEPFDPTHHEAVEETPGDVGKVLKELQPGFMLNGAVIIPAKVAVGKAKIN